MVENFEAKLARLKEEMRDPRYVERINDILVIRASCDGRRIYSPKEILTMNRCEVEAVANNAVIEKGSMSGIIGEGISLATDGFSHESMFTLLGKEVMDIVDDLYLDGGRRGWDPEKLAEQVEIVVAGALFMAYEKHFEDYQVDIFLEGQGVIPETYEMQIKFRPVPKNVAI